MSRGTEKKLERTSGMGLLPCGLPRWCAFFMETTMKNIMTHTVILIGSVGLAVGLAVGALGLLILIYAIGGA